MMMMKNGLFGFWGFVCCVQVKLHVSLGGSHFPERFLARLAAVKLMEYRCRKKKSPAHQEEESLLLMLLLRT